MTTSSMCPIQLFQTRFQLHCRHKKFNSCCKEEHLKGNRDWFTVTSLMQLHYFKKMFEGVWDSNFEWSEQVKFAKFLCSVSTGGTSWVTKLMESMNKWPTTLSNLISTTGLNLHNLLVLALWPIRLGNCIVWRRFLFQTPCVLHDKSRAWHYQSFQT